MQVQVVLIHIFYVSHFLCMMCPRAHLITQTFYFPHTKKLVFLEKRIPLPPEWNSTLLLLLTQNPVNPKFEFPVSKKKISFKVKVKSSEYICE